MMLDISNFNLSEKINLIKENSKLTNIDGIFIGILEDNIKHLSHLYYFPRFRKLLNRTQFQIFYHDKLLFLKTKNMEIL